MAVEQYSVVDNDWQNLTAIINDLTQRVVGQELHPTSEPTFGAGTITNNLDVGGDLDVTGDFDVGGTLTLDDLIASRLVATDASKGLESIDLVNWIVGTANRVTVTDDTAGGVTLSGPQDIHVNATPEFAGITIKDGSDDIIFYVDDDEMYFTALISVPIDTGMPIGLLLALTYNLE